MKQGIKSLAEAMIATSAGKSLEERLEEKQLFEANGLPNQQMALTTCLVYSIAETTAKAIEEKLAKSGIFSKKEEEDEEEIDIYSRLKEIVDNLNRYLHENDLKSHEDLEKIRNRLGSEEFVCEVRKRYWDSIFKIRNEVEELMEDIDV